MTSSHSALVFLFMVGGLIRGGSCIGGENQMGLRMVVDHEFLVRFPHEASLPGHLGFYSSLTGDPAPLPRFELLRRSRTVSNKL